jgi:short-subunit dehydrogenase
MDVRGKLVVVTGASQGIGAATSRVLAKQGARVILIARTRAKLQTVADQIAAAGGEAHVRPCDLSDPQAVQALADAIMPELGVPDVIINCAGAGRWLSVEETPIAEAVQMMQAPYFAAFFTTRAFLPKMLERNSGLIVNVQSPMSRVVAGGCTGYAAGRYALRAFNEGLRADLRGTGVKTCEVMFGEVESDYFTNNPGSIERIPKIATVLLPKLSTEQVAESIAVAVRKESALFMRPFMLKVILVLLWMFPPVVRWLVVKTGWQRAG